jgi:hypothetical protein
MEAGRQALISSIELASALARRLNTVAAPGVSLSAVGDIIELGSSLGGYEIVVHLSRIRMGPLDRTHVLGVVLLMVEQVQDFTAIEFRVPWPGQERQPSARVDTDDTSINVWFEDAGEVVMRLEPIPWTNIEISY